MKPLIVLTVSFLISVFVLRIINKEYNVALAARISMSIMLVFTALGHFLFSQGMALMVPDIIPFKLVIVYVTGVLELLFAVGLHIEKYREFTAWSLILFLTLMVSANINASILELNYQTGEYNGKGLMYLWFRIPLQALFIVWTYLSSIKFY
jgi:uncharacterized membrane protein